MNIYLDTAILAIPNYGADIPAGAQEIIDRLINFSIIISEDTPFNFVISDNVEDVLDIGYPTIESITDFLEVEGLTHVYTPKDLLKEYLTILSRAKRPEYLDIFEVFDYSEFNSDPSVPNVLHVEELVSETKRIFTAVGSQVDGSSWFVGSSMAVSACETYKIASAVDRASRDKHTVYGDVPFQFSADVRVLNSLEDLVRYDVAEEIWCTAQTSEQLHLAISLGALSIRRGVYPEAELRHTKKFSIGSDFRASLVRHEGSGTGKFSSTIFKVCAQIVSNLDLADKKPMGLNAQNRRLRDQAAAWRTHISKKGAAIRLMHWEIQNEIEFANVEVKHDVRITDGVPEKLVSVDLRALL